MVSRYKDYSSNISIHHRVSWDRQSIYPKNHFSPHKLSPLSPEALLCKPPWKEFHRVMTSRPFQRWLPTYGIISSRRHIWNHHYLRLGVRQKHFFLLSLSAFNLESFRYLRSLKWVDCVRCIFFILF